MFWRLEQLLGKLQGKDPLLLISGYTSSARTRQNGLVLIILILSGNALFGLLFLARKISPLRWKLWFEPTIFWFIFQEILFNFGLGFLAWLIYRYLRSLARRRHFFK